MVSAAGSGRMEGSGKVVDPERFTAKGRRAT